MTSPIISIGDRVLASFPSGWTLGGRVIMIVTTTLSTSYEVEFGGGFHNSFDKENVKKA